MVLATVPAAPPTRKNLRATSCPAPISANVPYLAGSKLIWRAFSSVPISICGFMHFSKIISQPPQIVMPRGFAGRLCQTPNVRLTWRLAQTPTGLLQTDLLRIFRRNPTSQVIRQHRVGPIPASAQNLNFTSRRQRENAIGGVCCSEARLHILADDNCERTPLVAVLQHINRPRSKSRHEQATH